MTSLYCCEIKPHRIVSCRVEDKMLRIRLASGAEIMLPVRGAVTHTAGQMQPGFAPDASDCESAETLAGTKYDLRTQLDRNADDALMALVALGKSKADARLAVQAALRVCKPNDSTEEILRLAAGGKPA